jgi:RNA repair pathway DNA polymerase beta family
VPGFGTPKPRFEQFQEHHIHDHDALTGKGRTYDLTIYGIVKFFNLAQELNKIARGCITTQHSQHYFGFAAIQWKLFEKERPRRVKPLLWVYRVLLTGTHLMRTGGVEANLVRPIRKPGCRTSLT